MQEMMKEKMGGKWEEMKVVRCFHQRFLKSTLQNNLTGDMTGLIEQFKKQFDELKNTLENALTPKTGEERRKRDAEELFRVKRADEATAEPESEPEPEGDEYYCIKKTLGGNTVKSCLPKVCQI